MAAFLETSGKTLLMKRIVLLLAVAFVSFNAVAQNTSSSYKTSIGAKGYFANGSIGGINVKHFLKSNTALEGSLLFKDKFFALEGIYEWHGDINGARGLHWYVGPGAMLGFVSGGGNNSTLFGLKGTVGLDYKFTGAPINIAFDVNPTFTFAPASDFDFMAGLAFRFAF